jgi:hypothetical protein
MKRTLLLAVVLLAVNWYDPKPKKIEADQKPLNAQTLKQGPKRFNF